MFMTAQCLLGAIIHSEGRSIPLRFVFFGNPLQEG